MSILDSSIYLQEVGAGMVKEECGKEKGR